MRPINAILDGVKHRGNRLRSRIGIDWRVRFTIDLMRRDLCRALAFAALSRRANLSPSRFAPLFQRDAAPPASPLKPASPPGDDA